VGIARYIDRHEQLIAILVKSVYKNLIITVPGWALALENAITTSTYSIFCSWRQSSAYFAINLQTLSLFDSLEIIKSSLSLMPYYVNIK
jgi:hypothetical protein